MLFCVAKQYENISIRKATKNPVLILSLESIEFSVSFCGCRILQILRLKNVDKLLLKAVN